MASSFLCLLCLQGAMIVAVSASVGSMRTRVSVDSDGVASAHHGLMRHGSTDQVHDQSNEPESGIAQKKREESGTAPATAETAKTQASLVSNMADTFAGIYARKAWVSDSLRGDQSGWKEGVGALSGPGSNEESTREFRSFLENFIVAHNVTSILDAGCGHWPSGYQRYVKWPSIEYHGVDVVPTVIEANRNLSRTNLFGLRSLAFDVAEISSELPSADLVLVKEVFLHVPNMVIENFIKNNLNRVAPRFKYFMAVGMMPTDGGSNETEDTYPGGVRHVDLRRRPFNLVIDRIEAGFNTVQLWRTS